MSTSSRCPVTSLPWAPLATTHSFMLRCITNSSLTCVSTSCPGEKEKRKTGDKGQASWRCLTECRAFTPPPLRQICRVLLQIMPILKKTTHKWLCGQTGTRMIWSSVECMRPKKPDVIQTIFFCTSDLILSAFMLTDKRSKTISHC